MTFYDIFAQHSGAQLAYDIMTGLLLIYGVRSFNLNASQHFVQNRAWVCFDNLTDVTGTLGSARDLEVEIRNTGVTPSNGTARVCLIDSVGVPSMDTISAALEEVETEEGVIAPNQSLILCSANNLSYDKNKLIGEAYVVGEITYETLGRTGKTTFCIFWDHPNYRAVGGNALNTMS